MSPLPPLRGSHKQVTWAEKIRDNALTAQAFNEPIRDKLRTINDATWWIANHVSGNKLVMTFKEPEPYQLVGGPPPPGTRINTSGYYPMPDIRKVMRRASEDGDENDLDEPHDAELFAESASHHPAVAQIAILGLMAKQYLRSSQKEVGELLLHRAWCQLDGLREQLIAALDKDLDGLERILK